MKKFKDLSQAEVFALTQVASVAIGLAVRVALVKNGSVKSFWWGLPHKAGTFR